MVLPNLHKYLSWAMIKSVFGSLTFDSDLLGQLVGQANALKFRT